MPKFQENVSLAQFSHYKIGGPARFFFNARSEKEIIWAVREAKKRKLHIFVLSGGTNLLISDKGFDGLVLKPNITFLKTKRTTLNVGTGVMMNVLLDFAAKKSLAGLSWAGGLPGALGGAIRGNAGCFGGEIKDVVTSVRSLDVKTMKIVTRSAHACGFGYRDSVFKEKNGSEIILSATLHLEKGDKKQILAAAQEKIMHRQKNHPLEHPNTGSTFKNVPLSQFYKKGSRSYQFVITTASMNYKGSQFSVKLDPFPVISTAKLISEVGLKGVSFGGAMISPKHPNFIVNVLGAQAEDVKNLITLAKAEVFRKFKVQLEEEVQII